MRWQYRHYDSDTDHLSLLMALAINIMQGRYSQRRWLGCIKPLLKQQKASYVLYITNKTEYYLYHQQNAWAWLAWVMKCIASYNQRRLRCKAVLAVTLLQQQKACNKTQCFSFVVICFVSNKYSSWKVLDFCESVGKVTKLYWLYYTKNFNKIAKQKIRHINTTYVFLTDQ